MIKLSKSFMFKQSSPYGCCAMTELSNFDSRHYYRGCDLMDYLVPNDLGLYFATFTENENSMAFYQELLDKLDLVFQSPIRERKNNGKKIFVCIFSDPARKDATC